MVLKHFLKTLIDSGIEVCFCKPGDIGDAPRIGYRAYRIYAPDSVFI